MDGAIELLHRSRRLHLEKVLRSTDNLNVKIHLIYDYLKRDSLRSTWRRFQEQRPSKSTDKAEEWRLVGNVAFRNKKYYDALRLYTESVANAPVGSVELALAYANRSAVLITMGKLTECLLDINRAFQENYPEARRQKLVDRKNKCVKPLQAVINCYKIRPNVTQSLTTLRDMDQLSKGFSPEIRELPPLVPPPTVVFNNRLIANASNKIKMEKIQDNDIGIIATANIKPGEIIAIDKPVAWNMTKRFPRQHCENCLCRTYALIPCPNCSAVMYCSERCRDHAFGLFHRVECEIFSKLRLEEADKLLENWTVVRVLLVITKQGKEFDKIRKNPEYKQPLDHSFCHNMEKVFNSQDFSSVMAHGRSTCDKSSTDFSTELESPLLRTVLTWVYHLRQSTFYGKQLEEEDFYDPIKKRELYVVFLLIKLSQATFQNLREGLRGMLGFDKGKTSLSLGHGLYPLVNIFRHSCEPNVYLYSYGTDLVCRAIRPIKAGEEIFICYYRPYYRCPRNERIAYLKEKYNFECTCRPCQQNWPTEDELPVRSQQVASDNTGARKFLEYRSKFQKLHSLNLDDLPSHETFEILSEYSSILDKRYEKPCREFIECERLLDLSLSLCGNFHQTVWKH